jgi:hypothetical protein
MTLFKKFQKLIKPYKQQVRGFLGWLFGLLSQMVLDVDAVMSWGLKRWLVGLGVAALPGIVGFMKGGDDNPTDEELYDRVHAIKKKRYVAGLEITDPTGLPLKQVELKP